MSNKRYYFKKSISSNLMVASGGFGIMVIFAASSANHFQFGTFLFSFVTASVLSFFFRRLPYVEIQDDFFIIRLTLARKKIIKISDMIDVKIDKKTIKITVIGRGAVSIHGHLLSKDDFAILSSAASEIGNRPK